MGFCSAGSRTEKLTVQALKLRLGPPLLKVYVGRLHDLVELCRVPFKVDLRDSVVGNGQAPPGF